MAAMIRVNDKYIQGHMIVLVPYFCNIGFMLHTRRPNQWKTSDPPPVL